MDQVFGDSNGIESMLPDEADIVQEERQPLKAGQLWQIPVFLLGLAALVSVVICRPLASSAHTHQFEQYVSQLRLALTLGVSDCKIALAHENELLALMERLPNRIGEVYFLLGSAYLRLGEAAQPAETVGELAVARQYLERAHAAGVSTTDESWLAFRLARCWTSAGADAGAIIELLGPAANDQFEEAAAVYALMVQAYLRLKPPDSDKAIATQRKMLALPTANESFLSPARLLQAELLAQKQEFSESRSLLLRISPSAPLSVRLRAREFLAELAQRQGEFVEAAAVWAPLLADDKYPPERLPRGRFELGRCYRALGQLEQAEASWKLALDSAGEVADAARWELADLALARNDAGAVEFFQRALEGVENAANYRNGLIDLAAACKRLREGCVRLRELGAFEPALVVAGLYARVAGAGESQRLIGEVEAAWAHALRAKRDDDGSRIHAAAAGAAYEAAASALGGERGLECWRLAAQQFGASKDYLKAVALYRRYLEVESSPEACGEGQLELGDAYVQVPDPPRAREAYLKCIEYPGHAAYGARFRLARMEAAAGNVAQAILGLQRCLDLMRADKFDPDDPLVSEIICALVDANFALENYQEVTARYEEPLNRSKFVPGLFRARLQVAESYRLLAESARSNARVGSVVDAGLKQLMQKTIGEQYQKLLQASVSQYQSLSHDLLDRGRVEPLSVNDQEILRRSDFALAGALVQLGNFQNASTVYERLAARYHSQGDELIALRGQYQCTVNSGAADAQATAKAMLHQIRTLIGRLNDSAFTDKPGGMNREQWLEWVEKELNPKPWDGHGAPPLRSR